MEVKDAKELDPEMKDMAHQVATKLMDNPIIHDHVTEILQENVRIFILNCYKNMPYILLLTLFDLLQT